MNALILNASNMQTDISRSIQTLLRNRLPAEHWSLDWVNLAELAIGYCPGCDSCSTRTPGVCIQQDVMQEILPKWVQSKLVVFLTPISFGSYHSDLKKAVDRLLPLMTGIFTIRGGELHHESRYPRNPSLLTVGLLKAADSEQAQIFSYMTERNALNWALTQFAAVVVSEDETPGQISAKIQNGLTQLGVQ